ncbi:hypothetical protein R3P38DRAFT_3179385 [Favolaschia claudopus]|uniref:Uncharacterized protein n=1 Tax=Favolaschia claudopus TaxID=2862362 RepID=A0AAW0CVR3_9AGAR
MLLKAFFSLLALAISVKAAPAEPGHVFTAVRVYKALADVSPYIVTKTTTFAWTQSPTTTIAEPTGSGI